ncbi:hypothetical protein DM02DRAFT_677466 [Periconia macrospinosa]|uniref:Uncharacterized protein n=1 Tax=Periconia macrospinosa TaxID=97972 RepID=A0A2V1D356_9PLEO|nr:hypothetical protein DM02DRAFT_677466 [Periconia macrospinosa]
MNRQTIEDVEGKPISNSKSFSGSAVSSPRNVAEESHGIKRQRSTEKDPEEESLNIEDTIAREAKRPKLTGKSLDSVVESMQKTVSKLDKIYLVVIALRKEHTKSMVDVVHWAENKRSEGSNSYTSGESDGQTIEVFKEYITRYRTHWRI